MGTITSPSVGRWDGLSLGSDHLAVVDTFARWSELRNNAAKRELCQAEGLCHDTLATIASLRRDYLRHLLDIGFVQDDAADAEAAAQSPELVRCVVSAGLYPRLARAVPTGSGGTQLVTRDRQQVFIHPASVNSRLVSSSSSSSSRPRGFLCYHTCIKTSKPFLHDCTWVGKYALLIFAGEVRITKERNAVIVNRWIKLHMPERGAVLCKLLRREIDRLMLNKIRNPAADLTRDSCSAAALAAVKSLLELDAADPTGRKLCSRQ